MKIVDATGYSMNTISVRVVVQSLYGDSLRYITANVDVARKPLKLGTVGVPLVFIPTVTYGRHFESSFLGGNIKDFPGATQIKAVIEVGCSVGKNSREAIDEGKE